MPRASVDLALAASIVPTTPIDHAFWDETDPAKRKAQRVQFLKNMAMMGGVLLATVDTAGKPGLAWRAQASPTGPKEARTRGHRPGRRSPQSAQLKVQDALHRCPGRREHES